MDVKRFYEQIGGDYENALSRLMNDALIEKFILKFGSVNYLADIERDIENRDFEHLFMSAHTLKGVSLNLSFAKLSKSSSELTELVRGDKAKTADLNQIMQAYKIVKENYLEITDLLAK